MLINHTKPEWLDVLNDRVKGLRFGKIELVIHQGKVTQIETTEKFRLEPGVSNGAESAGKLGAVTPQREPHAEARG